MSLLSRTAAAVGALWPFSKSSAPPPDDSPEVLGGWIRIYPGDELLARPENVPFVEKINANFRGTPSQAFELVAIPLSRIASLVQLLPAAEYYHHSERGGLLLHQLECMALATDANYQIHQMVDPRLLKDSVPPEFAFYTNYCFHIRALAHDIGKLHTLFNIELLVERADGRYFRKPYDAMDGGFATLSLSAHAAREKAEGARSVRYRYTFKRTNTIHDHESLWEIGVQRLLQHLPNPVPGHHFERHLTNSEAFRTYLQPKLAEIDSRSVVNYHTRSDRSASPEQLLYQQFLHDLASHPQVRSAVLVRSADGQQLLFLPYTVIQGFLNELPSTELYSSVPRHPQQCMFRLKGAGFTTRLIDVPTTDTLVDKYDGQVGVFLHANITTSMFGATSLHLWSENISASIGQLMDATSQTSTTAPVQEPDLSSSAAPDISAPTPQPPAQPLHGTSAFSDEPQDLSHQPPAPPAPPWQSDLEATTAAMLGASAVTPPPPLDSEPTQAHPLLNMVARHLEALPPQSLTQSPDVTIREGVLVFSQDFVKKLLVKVSAAKNKLSPRHFKQFSNDSNQYWAEKWAIHDGELICTSAYSARLLRKASVSQTATPASQTELTFDSLFEVAGRTPTELTAIPDHREVSSPPSTSPAPRPSSSPEPVATLPSNRDRDGEFKSLMACVRTIYQRTGERLLETDGQLARLDFRAVDEHTGDKQRRGRVLEMLRHLGLYIEHKKGTAVFIRPNHPEVQTCLADLQKKK